MHPEPSTFPSIDEGIRRRFENARRDGCDDPIESFLPPESDPLYRSTLEELVLIDLEYAWKRRGGQVSPCPVESYLDRFPLLDDPVVVRRLVNQEYRLRHRHGDGPAPEEYHRRFPGVLTEIELDTLLPNARQPRTDTLPAGPDVSRPLPRVPGYEVLEEIGRGGMGVVYRARQVELDRIVALKMLLSGERADDAERMRFRREARSAARLQHPNIVQLFEVGEANGDPFIAMEFVPGASLQRLISGTPLPPADAANLVFQLAAAMAYAHSQGIIHRDLKPANVLMSADGSVRAAPKIADFGLAKRLEDDAGLTASGDLLGTPCYMAPEQAVGRIQDIGPRTDVYSLGAILYQALIGTPPFRGATTVETLDQVRSLEPPPPRKLRPQVPRDLETICLKCLQKEPRQRYNSAQELADDLRRFLAGEPIAARPVGRLEKLIRWARREKKVAALTATIALVVGLAVLVGAISWMRAREHSRTRFEASLAEVDSELTIIGQEQFALVPQMDQSRRQLLERLARKCQALAETRGDDPQLLRKKAEVQHQLGTIHEMLGHYSEAESAYTEAIALRGRIADGGREPADDRNLLRSHLRLANLLVTLGRLDEAETHFGESLALTPDDDAHRAEALDHFGTLQVMTGRLAEGEQSYREACALQRQRVEGQPGKPADLLALAQTESSLANLLTALSRFVEAETLFDSAIRRQEQLAAESSALPVYRLGLARTLMGRSARREYRGRTADSAADLVRAYEILQKLAADHPQRPDYRMEAASVRLQVARLSNDTSTKVGLATDAKSMERMYREAVAEQERLVAEFPAVVEYRRRLAASLDTLATWVNDSADYCPTWLPRFLRLSESAALHQRSEDIWKALITTHPQVIGYQHGLTVSDQRYGIALERLGRLGDAEMRYRQGIQTEESLAARFPHLAGHQVTLAALNNNLGVIFDRRHDLAGAEEFFRTARSFSLRALEINPDNPATHYLRASNIANLGSVLNRRGKYRETAGFARELPLRTHFYFNEYDQCCRLLQDCAERAGRDSTLSSTRRAELQLQYDDWTMEMVRQVVSRSNDPKRLADTLAGDRALNRVRSRADFQELLADAIAKIKRP